MDEEKIFGPLTLRQFIYAAIGAALCYIVYTNIQSPYNFAAAIIIAGIAIAMIRNNPGVIMDERYIELKKLQSQTPEEFEKWIQKKLAEVHSQIAMREERGLKPNPKLEIVRKILESSRGIK